MDVEIFVIDNHSTDCSRKYLETSFPQVKFRWNKQNVGFAKANNQVQSEATGEYILFLNPDTILPEDCLEKCMRFFSSTPDCGALGVRMVDGAGNYLKESKRAFPSPVDSFFKMAGLTKLFPRSRFFAGYYAGHLPEHDTREVEVLAGAFMLLSKKALEKTGGFDEKFFMYAEDIDLSYRIREAGFKNYYFPQTTIVHFKGESTQKLHTSYIKYFYGAMLLFVKKHYHAMKGLSLLMHIAIRLSSLFAWIKLYTLKLLQGLISLFNNNKINQSVLVVGEVNKEIVLFSFSDHQHLIFSSVSIQQNEDKRDITTAECLRDLKKNKAKNLLFCEGEISFADIIRLMQQLKGEYKFLIHAHFSRSIVGSSSKNSKGIFISKD